MAPGVTPTVLASLDVDLPQTGVEYLLTGTVRWEQIEGGSRVRVTVALIRSSDAAMLDVQPTGLHQRVPVVLGSREEVAAVERYHAEYAAAARGAA